MLGVSIPTAFTRRSAASHRAADESIPGKCSSATPAGPVFVVPRYRALSGQRLDHPVRIRTIVLSGIRPLLRSHASSAGHVQPIVGGPHPPAPTTSTTTAGPIRRSSGI